MNPPASEVNEASIPAPAALPWLGHLLSIPKSRITQYLLETSRDFDGILALDFGGNRLPFVFDPELVQELSDPVRFEKTIGPPLSTLRRLSADGLFTARGDEPNWGKAHRILQPAFSQRAMKGYFPMMIEVAEQLAAKWTRDGQDADIAVADDMTRLTLDTISLAGFGYRFDSFSRQTLHPFLDAMVDVLGEVMQRLTRLPIQNRLMKGSLARIDRNIALMHGLVDDVIAARRAAGDAAPANRDLLALMLQARDPLTGEGLDGENIRSQVITFLIAGHETTSGLLTFALHLLMRHPEVLAQCYAEVDRVMPGGRTPRYEDLASLDVIERVLRETLRLWPTAPSYAVSPKEDCLLGGRYRLRAGQRVIIFLPALHRHPRHWERPDDFDIDRFLPQARARHHPHAYKPFGSGERACIGQQFALTEAKLALAVIFQRFALSDPYGYRLAIKETLTLKPDGFRLRARPRVVRPAPAHAMPAAARLRDTDVGSLPGGPGHHATPARPRPDTPMGAARIAREPFRILFGSSVGTCQEVAEQVAGLARAAGFQPQVQALDDALESLPAEGWLVVVTATYNGRAPDSAKRLESLLDAASPPTWQAPGLRYAVFGCGHSLWPLYQAFPKRVEQWVADSGAQAVLARGEADANGDFEGMFEQWLRRLEPMLGASPSGHSEASNGSPDNEYDRLRITQSNPSSLRAALLPAGAISLTVRANRELVSDATGLWDHTLEAPRFSTRHLQLSLPTGTRYATGDHLVVYPRNDEHRVTRLMTRLGLDPDTTVTLEGHGALARHLPAHQPIGLRQLLTEFVELQDPASRRDLERMARFTRCPASLAQLMRWLGNGPDDARARDCLQEEVSRPRLSVADLLDRFPAVEWNLNEFLATCAAMRPRWYSISSSAAANPDELTLTVGTVQGKAWSGNGEYRGVASNYLASLPAGAVIAAQVRTPSPDFAPPPDLAVPLILIGPGTGIAPFRGFVEERAWDQAHGRHGAPILLFTGARHPAHDALYADELANWQAEGACEWIPCYSSLAGHPWRHVQDALWARRDEVWRLLEAGARIFVCGDGKAMAPAVRETFKRLYREKTGIDPTTKVVPGQADRDVSQDWLTAMIDSGRYRQDIFT